VLRIGGQNFATCCFKVVAFETDRTVAKFVFLKITFAVLLGKIVRAAYCAGVKFIGGHVPDRAKLRSDRWNRCWVVVV